MEKVAGSIPVGTTKIGVGMATVDSPWKEIIEELDPCRDCIHRGRMWVIKCRDECRALQRWLEVRKLAQEKTAV